MLFKGEHKGTVSHADKGGMRTVEMTINRGSNIKVAIKWIFLFILLLVFALSTKSFHQSQLQKLSKSSDLLNQKTLLIIQMHKEMLSITSTQYQILHAGNQQQARQLLWNLSERVSDYLIHYHQLEAIADSSDVDVLRQFKRGYEQWHSFNKNLLGYAYVISDFGFINTLNMIDLTFTQFNSDADEVLQLIAQLKKM